MLTFRDKSVNVNRLEMIQAIKKGLELHRADYEEAYEAFKGKAKKEFEEASAKINSGDFSKTHLVVTPPTSHVKAYEEVIEMMEVSVDETINLDMESYKAYYKNEWSWTKGFSDLKASYFI